MTNERFSKTKKKLERKTTKTSINLANQNESKQMKTLTFFCRWFRAKFSVVYRICAK